VVAAKCEASRTPVQVTVTPSVSSLIPWTVVVSRMSMPLERRSTKVEYPSRNA
jgi:hypothetical protein